MVDGLIKRAPGHRVSLCVAGLLVATTLLVVACSGSDDDATQSQASDLTLTDGTVNVVERPIGETTITLLVYVPAGQGAKTDRVVLAFPPGGQDLELTRTILEETYQVKANERGWVVVSPVGPDGGLWFDADRELMEGLLDEVQRLFVADGASLALMGVSNGGLSAFHAFATRPEMFSGLVAYPGYPRSEDREDDVIAALARVPVRLFVGGLDTTWRDPMSALAAELDTAGGDVRLEVLEGEAHIIESLRDGQRLFDALDELDQLEDPS